MTLQELSNAAAVRDMLQQNANAVITFSAKWCGPCKATKPVLEQLAKQWTANPALSVVLGIVYEDALGDEIHSWNVRAFPTYVLFQKGVELERVEGADLKAVEAMILQHCKGTAMPMTGGATLGTSASGTAMTPQEARLARFGGGGGSTAATPQQKDENDDEKPAATSNDDTDVEMKDAADTADATTTTPDEDTTGTAEPAAAAAGVDPVGHLNPEFVKTLTENMGFALIRAQKGLLYGNGGTVEGAVEWLMEHQDDEDIDQPIGPDNTGSGVAAQSYKCNECGKILSNMANLEWHANKTGHSDFEESHETVQPMTAEEKAAKIAEIKQLLKAKRAQREHSEKESEKEREKQRRFMGKEMAKTREQMEAEQRRREVYMRKKEKEDAKRERARIRAEIAKDKAERAANSGKLSSKLSVAGYNPDGIQYDVPVDSHAAVTTTSDADAQTQQQQQQQAKKPKVSLSKIDEYIARVSSYKAGGDGGKCLKVLRAYVGNVVDNPTEEKYHQINMENKAFKTKVKPFVGGKQLLLAVGFDPAPGDFLQLKPDYDLELLKEVTQKLDAAMKAYGV